MAVSFNDMAYRFASAGVEVRDGDLELALASFVTC